MCYLRLKAFRFIEKLYNYGMCYPENKCLMKGLSQKKKPRKIFFREKNSGKAFHQAFIFRVA
jgi:hypothetical protein